MMDSEASGLDMFGDLDDESPMDVDDAPEYTNTEEFKKFIAEGKIPYNPQYGFT